MPHDVEQHLHISASEYDRIIRTFIPRYEEMQATQVHLLGAILGGRGMIIDLGGGTGALAEVVLAAYPEMTVEIWDVDRKMLAVAQERLKSFGSRIRLVERSFTEPLPACDGVTASLALHHVHDLNAKTSIYMNIYKALRSGGIFLNADATMSDDPIIRKATYSVWSSFMKSSGMGDEEVRKHFDDWKTEDRYFPLTTELDALRKAGFKNPECFWKYAATVVAGGRKE